MAVFSGSFSDKLILSLVRHEYPLSAYVAQARRSHCRRKKMLIESQRLALSMAESVTEPTWVWQ